jgi:pimeloyl-ACP methyl ester carboxylesterase
VVRSQRDAPRDHRRRPQAGAAVAGAGDSLIAGGSAPTEVAGGNALTRRIALARRRRIAPKGPPLRRLLGELTTLLWLRDLSPARRRAGAVVTPAQRRRPVMLLPGFGNSPAAMRRFDRALAAAGHQVHRWGLGFNLGPTEANFAFLMDRVAALAAAHGEPVALVGWSLGGLFAREIARRQPEHVACVITMGTPFSGDRRANNVWRLYELITGHDVDHPPIDCDFAVKPPVPTIALWSPRDGLVHPRSARGLSTERDVAVAVRCTHMGFAGAPAAIVEVLRHLDALP